jgi:monothiol glutaredoxin
MRDVMKEIETEVQANKVILYMKGSKEMPMCGFSARAVTLLREIGVDFKDVNILVDQEKREAIKKFSDWPTIPQLYIGGEFIGGSDIMLEMHQKGELEPMIKKIMG